MDVGDFTPEQIIAKLREVDVLVGRGGTAVESCRQIGTVEQTLYRWCNVGETFEPVVDTVRQTRMFKLGVMVLAMALDGLCKRRDRGRIKPLVQGLFRNRAAEAPVAIFEGVDGLEP